jgi:hypothetical protein
MSEATVRDAAYAARVAYKPPERVDYYLDKWNTPFKLEASHRLHHHNIYVLRDTVTGQIHVTASGSDNLHNWTRNVQRGAGNMPTNIVARFDDLLRDIKTEFGDISSASSHSGFCPYMSESAELSGVQKVFLNPDNVVPDEDTLMVAGKKDSLTKYTGQRQDCVILDESNHRVKHMCEALDKADLGDKPLSAVSAEMGYGNQALRRPDGRLVPDQHKPSEKMAADRAYKARKHELYEEYKRRHPSKFDDRKGHPKSKSARERIAKQAKTESENSPALQEEIARLRGLPAGEQASLDSGTATADAGTVEEHGNVEVGSRESTATGPTVLDGAANAVGEGFWTALGPQVVVAGGRWLYAKIRGERTPEVEPLARDTIGAAGETALVMGAGKVMENVAAQHMGLELAGWPGVVLGVVYNIFRPTPQLVPVCQPVAVPVSRQDRDALQAQQRLTPQHFTGVTRAVLEEAGSDDDVDALTQQHLDALAAQAVEQAGLA